MSRLADAVVANPIIAYGLVLVLQLRLLWAIWRHLDLTSGDTSFYYLTGLAWAHGLHDNVGYYPLYTNLLGTIEAVVSNAYDAVIAHRILIIAVVDVLILAVMRLLFVPALALLLTVWWVVLPTDYNAVYEVHLFSVLPVLVAALIVAKEPTRLRLGIALALLVASTFLLRHELIIGTVAFVVVVAVREWRKRRSGTVLLSYVRAYGLPLAVAALTIAFFYARALYPPIASIQSVEKLNVCEAFAFNYQQRFPERVPGNAMVNCGRVMQQKFGRPMPTASQAWRANPSAMAEFVSWNLKLLPSGLQVSLFDATSTGENPGYRVVHQHRVYALALSIVVLAVMVAGALVVLRVRGPSRFAWLRELRWPLVVLGIGALTTLVVVLVERPWADYMFGLVIFVIVLTGICLTALLRQSGVLRFLSAFVLPVVLVLLVGAHSHFSQGSRPLHDAVARLQPVRSLLDRSTSVLVTSEYNFEICAYLAERYDEHCSSPAWADLQAQLDSGTPLETVLDRAKATVIYADPLLQADPRIAKLVAAPAPYWSKVASGTSADGSWSVLVRRRP